MDQADVLHPASYVAAPVGRRHARVGLALG